MTSGRFKRHSGRAICKRIRRLGIVRTVCRGARTIGSHRGRIPHIRTERSSLLVGGLLAPYDGVLFCPSLLHGSCFRDLGLSHSLFQIPHFGLLSLVLPFSRLIGRPPILIAQRGPVLYPYRGGYGIGVCPRGAIVNWTGHTTAGSGGRCTIGMPSLPIVISFD